MKKLLSFIVAGGLLIGSAGMAAAADIKVKGTFEFGFGMYDTGFLKHDEAENFDALQRFRTQIDIIASESLKGVAFFEIGNTYWGAGGGSGWGGIAAGRGSGGAMGADGVSIEVRQLYIDWLVPDTDLQVRMGIQPFAPPRAVYRADGQEGNFIVDDDMAGILLAYDFNDNFGINFGWFRPWDGSTGGDSNDPDTRYGDHDEIDIFALTLPFEMKDTFSFTPYAMYALIGDTEGMTRHSTIVGDANIGAINAAATMLTNDVGGFGANGDAWWAGFAFDLAAADPIDFGVDFAYGSYDSDNVYDSSGLRNVETDRSGWVVISKLGYKLDYFTPILFGWYGSGADDFDEHGRDGLMPVLSPDWGMTSFGWSGGHPLAREYQVGGWEGNGSSPIGTWAIGIGLEDIKYIENLTSHLRVAYFRGTSDMSVAATNVNHNGFLETGLLDKSDSGIEVNLDNVVSIYENLDMYVEVGYLKLSLDHEPRNFDSSAWKGYVGFTYSF